MLKPWKKTTLGESCEMYQPKTITRKEMVSDGEFPVYGANGIIGQYNKFNHQEPELVIGCRGSIGMVHITEPRSWINGNAMVIRSKNGEISQAFLRYLFLGAIDISNTISGTAQPQITRKSLTSVEFSFPTDPKEQQRIVGILDEAFNQVGNKITQAEQKLHNGKELFQSVVANIFSQKGDDWGEATLGEVSKFSQGIQVGLELQKTEPQNGYVRFIRIIDYTQQTDDIRYVEDPGPKYFVSEDDLVMVRYGTPGLIGRGIEGVIANNLFKITLHSENLLNDYVDYFLSQPHIQKYLSTQGSATMPALTFKQLKTVKVAIPSLATQKVVVEKLDSLSQNFEFLEENLRSEIESLVELKQSILQEAFSGKLTGGITA